jgi:hypothetical protein
MFLQSVPYLPSFPDPQALKERQGFCAVKGGFFLRGYKGGARMAQIHVQSSSGKDSFLSDGLLYRGKTIFTILVISNGEDDATLYTAVKALIAAATIDPVVVSEESIILFNPSPRTASHESDAVESFSAVKPSLQPDRHIHDSDWTFYLERLGRQTKFAIVRPDFFVFACAKDASELGKCLALLKDYLYEGQ